MESLLFSLGYFGIFTITFLSATLLTFSSEIIVILALSVGYSPLGVLIVATLGNFGGSLTNFYLGKLGDKFILAKYLKTDNKYIGKAKKLYKKRGPIILFFSWIPIIGDPLCVVAGALNIKLRSFTIYVLLGKFTRFFIVILLYQYLKIQF